MRPTKRMHSHISRACFQIRTEWKADHSKRVIAIYDGQPGGTKNRIDYARKMGVSLVNIQTPNWRIYIGSITKSI